MPLSFLGENAAKHPVAFRMSPRCQWATFWPEGLNEPFIGGDEGIRTLDLCSAIAALSQLSYIPTFPPKLGGETNHTWRAKGLSESTGPAMAVGDSHDTPSKPHLCQKARFRGACPAGGCWHPRSRPFIPNRVKIL